MSQENIETVQRAYEAVTARLEMPQGAVRLATVSPLREGRAIRVKAYSEHAQALEAVGLRE